MEKWKVSVEVSYYYLSRLEVMYSQGPKVFQQNQFSHRLQGNFMLTGNYFMAVLPYSTDCNNFCTGRELDELCNISFSYRLFFAYLNSMNTFEVLITFF